MPKIYLTRQDKLKEKLVALIYGKMKVMKRTQQYMADKLGISQPAYARKLRVKQFTHEELATIFEELDMQDEEILSVMRF